MSVNKKLRAAARRLLKKAAKIAKERGDIFDVVGGVSTISLGEESLSFSVPAVSSLERVERVESEPVEPVLVFEDFGERLSMLPFEEEEPEIPTLLHEIPEDLRTEIPSEWNPPDFSRVDERYPLIPPHAYAHIYFSDEEGILRYDVEEPILSKKEKEALERIKTLLVDKLDVDAYALLKKGTAKDYIARKFEEIVREYRFDLTTAEKERVKYYVLRDFVGLERIEPLMRDPHLEDISCIGPGIPIYVYHRSYGPLKTNVVFETAEELNQFIVKLAQMCGKHVSVANPLFDGALPDGSRVQATYAVTKDISTRGSTFTIRKFTTDPLTVTDLIKFGTLTPLLAAYLWLAIEYRQSILIAGGTASGKTTMLNALALFIPPGAKVVSIEDTPELRLPHEHWVQKIARESEEGGKVTMFDLLKAALRERPDYIVVGEVRGKEAYVLFQGMATGHPGLATIHAEDMDTLVDRLITPPISLPPSLLHSLDIIMFMTRARIRNMDVRRIKEVHEVMGVNLKEAKPVTNKLIEWVPREDKFVFTSGKSHVIDKIIEYRGVSAESVWGELRRRAKVLSWMKERGIRYYKDVGRIIARYYKDPESVLEEVEKGA